MCSYSSTPFVACVLLCSSTLFLVLLLLWCLVRYVFVNPWPSNSSWFYCSFGASSLLILGLLILLFLFLCSSMHLVVLLCSSNWYCLSLLLCASVGKLEVFFKFHSISRCFNFNLFFVCKFFLKLFCSLLCARPKNTIIHHTSIHKKH